MRFILKDFKKLTSFLILCLLNWSCTSNQSQFQNLKGVAFGTSYSISYVSDTLTNAYLSSKVDSLFGVLNSSLSTYIPDSAISRINRGDSMQLVDEHFIKVYQKASEVWERSSGYFDPTVGALVNAYGFGPGKSLKRVTEFERDSILVFTGWSKTKLTKQRTIEKEHPNIYLDFNALAKGYAVDVVAAYLIRSGVAAFLVEVGGEIVAKGKSPKSADYWKIAIDDPQQGEERNFIRTITLQNEALATSGNYRKYAVDPQTGVRIAHSINPKTGNAFPSKVLSTSVKAPDCMTADAYATALMVMPLKESQKLIESDPALEAYWIVSDSVNGVKEFFSKNFLKQ